MTTNDVLYTKIYFQQTQITQRPTTYLIVQNEFMCVVSSLAHKVRGLLQKRYVDIVYEVVDNTKKNFQLGTAFHLHRKTHSGCNSTQKKKKNCANLSHIKYMFRGNTIPTSSCDLVNFSCQEIEFHYQKGVSFLILIMLQWKHTHPRMFGQHTLVSTWRKDRKMEEW